MKMPLFWLALLLAGAVAWPAQARHQFELQSTYLGQGWFEYRLRSFDDPMFPALTMEMLRVGFQGNGQWGLSSTGWTASYRSGTTNIGWSFTNCGPVVCQPRPYEATFLAHSDYLHFRRSDMELVGFSYSRLGGFHGLTATNTIGLLHVSALIPCRPEEADGAPTNLLQKVAINVLPDPAIINVVQSNNTAAGLRFSYPSNSTMQLQVSSGLNTWSNVTSFYGNPGTNVWLSPVPLSQYGKFFRLLLQSEGHAP